MKYTILIITSILLLHLPVFGQERAPAKITWGKELVEPNNTFISNIIPFNKEGFYALREKVNVQENGATQKIYIEKYNEHMNMLKSKEIVLKYKKKKLDFEELLLVGRQLYLLSSFHNQAKKKNYLFAQKINRKSLTPSVGLIKIADIDTRGIMKEGFFDYHISRDSSKVLVYNKIPSKKGKPEKFALQVYDDHFNELWTKEITLPYDDQNFAVEEYQVDNEGNVYLLGVIYQDRSRTRRKGKPTYQYTILAYTQDGTDAEEYRIKFSEKFITDLTFRVADDGDLICSGFYSEKGTYSIKGTYYFRLNSDTKEVYNKNLKEFDFEFLTENMRRKQVEKAKRADEKGDEKREAELYSYSLDELVLRSDGGALLIAEQYYVERDDYNDYYGYSIYDPYYRRSNRVTDYYYNYNDIIVVNIKPTGEIEWSTRIPKRQETRNDGGYFSSYALSIVRDKIYFVYNDNGRNFQADRNSNRIHYYNGSQSVIALAEVSRDGSVMIYPLFSNREADIITRPKICKQSGRREMIIYGERNRRYRFANLEFQQTTP